MEIKKDESKKLDATKTNDDEIVENLEVLMNLETLEQADSWDFMMGLSELSDDSADGDESRKED